MKRELTIATPCLNEEAALPGYFERIESVRATLRQDGWSVSLLLIDDGSDDATPALLRRHADAAGAARVWPHPRNLGYGAAIKTALALASTDWVAFVDADTNYDQALILELARLAEDDTDLINVSIFAPGGRPGYGWHRRVLSESASWVYRGMLPQLTRGIHTMTCGFRWYRRASAQRLFPWADSFFATSEIMLRALGEGLKVKELPAANHPRLQGVSKMKVVRETAAHLGLATRAVLGRLGPPMPISLHLERIGAVQPRPS